MIYEDRAHPGDWRVEKLDSDGETCHVAAFSGPLAWQRVLRYADRKYGWCESRPHPSSPAENHPTSAPPESLGRVADQIKSCALRSRVRGPVWFSPGAMLGLRVRRLGGRRLPVCRLVFCAWLLVLVLAGCGGGPSRDDVIAQAGDGDRIAFDIVKIDDAVLTTLLAQPQPGFDHRFKTQPPPPELKIAVGDTVSVVIWESAANGLFGNSLTELTLPAGAAARLSTEPSTTLRGLAELPLGLTTTPDLLAFLFGGSAQDLGRHSRAQSRPLWRRWRPRFRRRGAEWPRRSGARRCRRPLGRRSRRCRRWRCWRPLPRHRFRPVAGGSGRWFPG